MTPGRPQNPAGEPDGHRERGGPERTSETELVSNESR